ncbi:DNA mismatch repair protein MutL [Agaricicola taiwanensis]|uniref:DNA mismatch repair protein MutL n=1 Tax=Agaricicola taiwanensis TaxID=591372 RepID=A0A8J2VND9_9RHOB|nr:DNA mismatch repair endonuclease MutL [Agaricicola taiwanensis]GGE34284.1 DNA mismatch repair protein MutL [Agaricicola taiwanensis]
MSVRLLPETLSNRIAAGEVVERPASVVKELVENAIDAGAGHVEIVARDGGTSLIRITDDGHGMNAGDLTLCVERHATSKLPDDDLLAVRHLGFRGEALPSIGSVARLTITTRTADAPHALALTVDHGRRGDPRPAAGPRGTRVDVEDLFAALPARRKFLKTNRTEAQAIAETVRRLAAARPDIDMTLVLDDTTLRFERAGGSGEGVRDRLAVILGRDFAEAAVPVSALREGVSLSGLAALPTYTRANAAHQLLTVNGRPVRDRQLIGAIRAAYGDLLPRDRQPAVALSIELDPQEVDVNVHPAKAEVRFRDPGLVRGLVISGLRAALADAGPQPLATGAARASTAFRAPPPAWPQRPWSAATSPSAPPGFQEPAQSGFGFAPSADMRAAVAAEEVSAPEPSGLPLGAAKAQLHDTYIVSQTEDGLILVDMHAAHERLVYEKLKRERAASGVARQALLVPEVIDLGLEDAERVAAAERELAALGLVVEGFGPGAVLVRETPAALGTTDVTAMVRDVADALAETGSAGALEDRLDRLAATVACHHSIRAGRRLKPDEMNALLRAIEAEPAAGTCNHGRPTFVALSRADLERLFARR